jgi:hypothetical protein
MFLYSLIESLVSLRKELASFLSLLFFDKLFDIANDVLNSLSSACIKNLLSP